MKWAGGKRWLIPRLREIWSRYPRRRLVEPFCGGLAVALGLAPELALLNDINPHTINFYHQVKNGLRIQIPMSNDRALYDAHRAEFNAAIERGRYQTKKAAALFYFLNRTGYNGLCRFNRRGKFNVPFGRYERINYLRDFTHYQPAFLGWTLVSEDFIYLDLAPSDFVYADPPYDVNFRQYSAGSFGWEDQVRLAHWLKLHPGPVIASNQATDRILELYQGLGFEVTILSAPRMINSSGDRTRAREMFATRGCDSA